MMGRVESGGRRRSMGKRMTLLCILIICSIWKMLWSMEKSKKGWVVNMQQ